MQCMTHKLNSSSVFWLFKTTMYKWVRTTIGLLHHICDFNSRQLRIFRVAAWEMHFLSIVQGHCCTLEFRRNWLFMWIVNYYSLIQKIPHSVAHVILPSFYYYQPCGVYDLLHNYRQCSAHAIACNVNAPAKMRSRLLASWKCLLEWIWRSQV